MTTDDLKDQLLSVWQKISERIQETGTYQQLKERFDGLSPQMQKITAWSAGGFILFLMLLLPFSWWSDSQTQVESFESRRQITRELFKVAREVSEAPQLMPPPPASQLATDLSQRVRQGNLLEEQIKAIDSNAQISRLVPTDKADGAFQVSLAKLNVSQIVSIGTALTGLSSAVKMTGLEILANKKEPQYFDVVYKMVSLKIPALNGHAEGEAE